MIVIFGSSSDVGRRLATRLTEAGHSVRRVARDGQGDVVADLRTGSGVEGAMSGARIVVSCAHAEFSDMILKSVPATLENLVLMGSAWRHTRIPNAAAEEVRRAEMQFVRGGVNGVMLHPTMIYGGEQENNIARLLTFIQRAPFIPAPDGGGKVVQPVYVDDVVDCLFAVTTRTWTAPTVVDVAGPPLTWRKMVEICCTAIGVDKTIVSVPSAPIALALTLLDRVGLRWIDPNILRRFEEEITTDLRSMETLLGVVPREFEVGIKLAVAAWRDRGILS